MKTRAALASLLASLLAATLASIAAPAVARATPYESFIDVESEDDLYDLLAASQISAETFEILRTLLARGVDLDRAPREELYSLPNLTYDDVDAILIYRGLQGHVGDPAGLVVAGALTKDKLVAIAAFLTIRARDRDPNRPRGWVRVFTRGSTGGGGGDDRLPPIGLRARMMAGRRLTAGLAASLTRLRIGAPTWDPNRNGLIADEAATRPHVPKFFVRYRGDEIDLIAGTYRMGFGERLTFDNSSDYTPDGIYLDDQLNRDDGLARRCRTSTGELTASPCSDDYRYVTPDYRWSDGLRGVAASADHLAAGTGYVAAHVFGSYASRSIYQYELVDRAACPDPRDDNDPACAAPPVYVRPDGAPLAPTAEHAYQTLPNAYAEALVGANLTFHARRRDFVGVTGYGATTQWLIDTPDGVQLDTQEWSRVPIGGRYGAIGANVGIGRGIYDIFAEVTHSFDRMPDGPDPIGGGGGPAVVVRATRTERRRELELSARYYAPDFVNPYAGPIAAPDEVEGQRARGEHGVRARYTGSHGGLNVHGTLDVWRALANTTAASAYEYVPRIAGYVRGDVLASERLGYGLDLRYQDKDLGVSGSDECYEVLFEDDEDGEPIACRGRKLTTSARVRFVLDRKTLFAVSVNHSLLDDRKTPTSARQDVSALATATWKPQPTLRVRGRVRYRSEDVTDNTNLEQSLSTFVEAQLKLRKKDTLAVRADLILWLDERERTALRSPSPEIWLGGQYQASF